MGKKVNFCIRVIAFLIIVSVIVWYINRLLIPKYFYDNDWPTTATYLGFYQMEKNTIDVIFLGSSHAVAAFSPQELYNQQQIRSYNLACEQQNPLVSYYWLKETLKYQKPQVVIMDTRMFFSFNEEYILNTSEECTRKAFDFMRWSSVKREAVADVCDRDKEQSITSFFFPNIRYHERWNELNKNDFMFDKMKKHYELKGQAIMKWYTLNATWEPIVKGTTNEIESMHEVMAIYLDKIVELCKKEEIQLVLVKTPTEANNIGRYNTMNQYAKENKILFIDFNEKEIYDEIGYCYEKDNADKDHVAISGAHKVTGYLGELLKYEYRIMSVYDEQWESTKNYYQNALKEL